MVIACNKTENVDYNSFNLEHYKSDEKCEILNFLGNENRNVVKARQF